MATKADVLARIRARIRYAPTPGRTASTVTGRMPPRDAITAWCEARGIDPSRAYLIQRAIQARRMRERDS